MSVKKANNKYYKSSIAQSDLATVPAASPAAKPDSALSSQVKAQKNTWSGKVGSGIMVLNLMQGLVETFYRCDTLIEAAEEIIEQLSEYNEDYGFGESQSTGDKLLSNLKLIVGLFPSISEVINDTNFDTNKIKNKYDDIKKFLAALSECEQQLPVINSYLTENKGGMTKVVEVFKSVGLSPFETDTISAMRAIGDFYTHVTSYKTILERAVKAYDEQLKKIQESNEISMNSSESLPKTTYKNKSNLSEFADIIF
jgi:hypothetical protein